MTDDPRARQAELDQNRIDAFVVRARRVEAHSLAQDRKALVDLAGFKIHVRQTEGQPPKAYQIFPPEEMVESAAARVRPYVLSGESVYHASVTKALEGAIRANGTQQMKDNLQVCRANWKKFGNEDEDLLGFSVQVQDGTTLTASSILPDKKLAYAYIYGDTVHADDERLAETDEFGVEHRFKAAVPIVAGLMVTSIMTLGLVRSLHEAGLITISQAALDVPVVVDKTVFEYEQFQFHTAPVDETRPHPDLNAGKLSDEWEQII